MALNRAHLILVRPLVTLNSRTMPAIVAALKGVGGRQDFMDTKKIHRREGTMIPTNLAHTPCPKFWWRTLA